MVFKVLPERELAIALGSSYERGNTRWCRPGVLRSCAPRSGGSAENLRAPARAGIRFPPRCQRCRIPPSPAEQAVFANLLGLLYWRTSQGRR